MLVAFASFVLHGSAMARVAAMHASTSVADHHHHDDGTHHHHAAAESGADHHGAGTDAPDHHGPNGLCCGSFCAAAIAPLARDAMVSRQETSAVLPVFEANGHGIPEESPRKPPRTPDIA
jgi:hypothetical protein